MSVATLLGKMILMIMLSDDMSSLSHVEFMEVICEVCAMKGAYPRKAISDRILELIHPPLSETHHQ